MNDSTSPPTSGRVTRSFRLHPATVQIIPGETRDQTAGPQIDDLTGCLRFAPREGRIWFDNERVSLIHLSSLGSLRNQLIDRLGTQEARGLLTRMGYAAGTKDAIVARRLRAHQPLSSAFLSGPQLHTIHGLVYVQPVRLEGDTESGRFYGEFLWHKCYDAETHLATYGSSTEPVCWMQIGYATGYTSTFMGRPILYKEVECHACGAPHCRIVGKPPEDWDPGEIDAEQRALQPQDFANRFAALRNRGGSAPPESHRARALLEDMVGASPGFTTTCHMAQKVAGTSATVLFLGDTGVGKGRFAKVLHQISDRSAEPFVAMNCSAIPDNLVEAELFGVARGAFTGAIESRPGRFERAHRGTLFLDEVALLSMPAQIKLLRAIQEKEVERVGDNTVRKVDVRIIAATNQDLRAAVAEGTFREDLMYRLNVFPIHIPPLRERREDIPLLMEHFLHRFTKLHGKQVSGFTNLAVDALYQYDYPGNIRELENLIERAVIMVEERQPIDLRHLFASTEQLASVLLKLNPTGSLQGNRFAGYRDSVVDAVLDSAMSYNELELGLIEEAMRRAGGNISRAARLLGVKRSHVAYRLKTRKEDAAR